jgi:hypothetical protein
VIRGGRPEEQRRKGAITGRPTDPGNLFSTGLVAGGALGGVLVAFLTARAEDFVKSLSLEEKLTHVVGADGYQLVGVAAFSVMGAVLYGLAIQKGREPSVKPETPKP